MLFLAYTLSSCIKVAVPKGTPHCIKDWSRKVRDNA